MCKIEGIILDVDGTLWDSRAVVAKAWNQAVREKSCLERTIGVSELTSLFGKPMTEISRKLFPELSEQERAELSEHCYAYENRLLKAEHGKLFPGVYETIAELHGVVPLFIVSNCQKGYIEVCLQTTGLDSYISDFICFGDNGYSKADNIRLLMERNKLNNAVYVGDTQGDANACHEAGIPIIAAEYGFGNIEKADYRISCFQELLSLPCIAG